MRYWDASALVPLVVAEKESDCARTWLKEDPAIVTWCWSSVELAGAVERGFRQGLLTRRQRRRCLDGFFSLAQQWDEVVDWFATRAHAISLLARHRLRAADAAQLAAALLVAEGDPAAVEFACLDARLTLAAEKEGFRVLDQNSQ